MIGDLMGVPDELKKKKRKERSSIDTQLDALLNRDQEELNSGLTGTL